MARPPLNLRLKKAFADMRGKEFIPPLNPFGPGTGFPAGRIKTYDSKRDQISALTSWVFTANAAIADPCAAVEYKLYRKKKDGDKEEVTSGAAYDDIMELIDAPNIIHTGEQLRQLHFTYMNIIGESYIYMRGMDGNPFIPQKGKLPAALEIIPAHLAQFVPAESGKYSESAVRVGKELFPILSFIRDINPDPSNPNVGRSIVAAAAQAIGTNDTMKEWNQNFFANNARPSLIFTSNEPMDDDAYKRWKDQFYDNHTGIDNVGKPLLIEGGDAKPLTPSQSDLEFLEGQKFSRDEILAMFRVSPGMIGQVENVNRSNLEAGFYVNAVTNVVPRVRQFAKQLNATLIKTFDPSLELDFVNPVPEDVEAKLAAVTAGVNKWWTIDEARDQYGEKPLPDDLGNHIIIAGKGAPVLLEDIVNGVTTATDGTHVDDPEDVTEDPDEDDNGEDSTDETKALAGVKKKT